MASEKEKNNCDNNCDNCYKEKIYSTLGYTCMKKGLFMKIYEESKNYNDEEDDI